MQIVKMAVGLPIVKKSKFWCQKIRGPGIIYNLGGPLISGRNYYCGKGKDKGGLNRKCYMRCGPLPCCPFAHVCLAKAISDGDQPGLWDFGDEYAWGYTSHVPSRTL
jgi:hypothetical protein